MSEGERRRHPRYEVEGIEGRLDREHPFDVLKLSRGGLLVKLRREQEPPLEQVTDVELTLGGEPLRCQAQVVFVGPDLEESEGHDLFRVGLAFHSLSATARRLLDDFIEQKLAPL
jgi:hypothetical protein